MDDFKQLFEERRSILDGKPRSTVKSEILGMRKPKNWYLSEMNSMPKFAN